MRFPSHRRLGEATFFFSLLNPLCFDWSLCSADKSRVRGVFSAEWGGENEKIIILRLVTFVYEHELNVPKPHHSGMCSVGTAGKDPLNNYLTQSHSHPSLSTDSRKKHQQSNNGIKIYRDGNKIKITFMISLCFRTEMLAEYSPGNTKHTACIISIGETKSALV